jgi:steroid Delta-isomerase
MPSVEQITATVNRYLDTVSLGRPDDIAALYTDDATVEDPVGGEVHIGRQAIRGFYKAVEGAESTTEIITLRVLGHEAAYFWRLVIGGMSIEIISVMTFDQDAQIASMKAYWGPENITQV